METEEAVTRFTPEFCRLTPDHRSFGPAKMITNAMLADGVDMSDQEAVEGWVEAFNARPFEERDEFLPVPNAGRTIPNPGPGLPAPPDGGAGATGAG